MSVTLEELKEMAEEAFSEYSRKVTADHGQVAVELDDLMGHCFSSLKYEFERRVGYTDPKQRLDWYCTGAGSGIVLVLELKGDLLTWPTDTNNSQMI